MKKYIGTKEVSATPAWRVGGKVYLKDGAYPRSMNREDGYKVVYEDGYESWSPKDVFEKAYKCSETSLDRMEIERQEVDKKLCGLNKFINSDKFKELDLVLQGMLKVQYQVMQNYISVLCSRSTSMEAGFGGHTGFSFGVAIEYLKAGCCVRRSSWNCKSTFVTKQIPAHIESNIIPKMQSLPKSTKDKILEGPGYIDYNNQCLIINSITGQADSWVPSISDVFADDWEIVL